MLSTRIVGQLGLRRENLANVDWGGVRMNEVLDDGQPTTTAAGHSPLIDLSGLKYYRRNCNADPTPVANEGFDQSNHQ